MSQWYQMFRDPKNRRFPRLFNGYVARCPRFPRKYMYIIYIYDMPRHHPRRDCGAKVLGTKRTKRNVFPGLAQFRQWQPKSHWKMFAKSYAIMTTNQLHSITRFKWFRWGTQVPLLEQLWELKLQPPSDLMTSRFACAAWSETQHGRPGYPVQTNRSSVHSLSWDASLHLPAPTPRQPHDTHNGFGCRVQLSFARLSLTTWIQN